MAGLATEDSYDYSLYEVRKFPLLNEGLIDDWLSGNWAREKTLNTRLDGE